MTMVTELSTVSKKKLKKCSGVTMLYKVRKKKEAWTTMADGGGPFHFWVEGMNL